MFNLVNIHNDLTRDLVDVVNYEGRSHKFLQVEEKGNGCYLRL